MAFKNDEQTEQKERREQQQQQQQRRPRRKMFANMITNAMRFPHTKTSKQVNNLFLAMLTSFDVFSLILVSGHRIAFVSQRLCWKCISVYVVSLYVINLNYRWVFVASLTLFFYCSLV